MRGMPYPGIRGRSIFRSGLATHESESGSDSRMARTGRSRAYLPISVTFPSIEVGHEAPPGKKPKSPALALARVLPSSAVVAVIMLAFLLFAALVARNLNSVVVSERSAAVAQPLTSAVTEVESNIPANVDTEDDVSTYNRDSSAAAELSSHSNSADAVTANTIDDNAPTGTGTGSQSPARPPAVASDVLGDVSGRVSWTRSWPLTEADDVTGLYKIAAALKFTNKTMLNYFHMHKTGGVTTKTQIREVINNVENKKQLTKRGQPLGMIETCYKSVSPLTNLSVLETTWRCDFRQIKELPADQLNGIDVVVGHQYWNKGCDFYFGTLREIRYFSIFRHPLHRKLSFYYHFFARNTGRDENDVPRDELLKFVLADNLPNDPRMRDAGPNYFASRMLSDGMSGFKANQYPIEREEQDAILDDILSRLDNRFVFTGLQLQTEANQCMMAKTVQILAHAHGVDTLVGTPKLAESQKRLNSGEYPWTGQRLWKSMSEEQKNQFRQVEKLDLAIYHKAVEIFKKSVKLFGCEHKVVEENWQEDDFQ